MQTPHLKKFAGNARNILRLGVEARLIQWGFQKLKSGFGEQDPAAGFELAHGGFRLKGDPVDYAFAEDLERWHSQLSNQLRLHTWDDVVEEAAYAWFNRLMMLRILESGNHIPPCLAMESETDSVPPILTDILSDAPAGLSRHQTEVYILLSNQGNALALFEMALLHRVQHDKVLETVFGHLENWMLPLCPQNLYGKTTDSFLTLLAKEGPTTEDYQEVELLGWLYQFYIADRKAAVDAAVKKGEKVRSEDLPAKTQIFTPRWIVDYMVQNTVGRTWLCHHPDSRLAGTMKYLVDPAEGQEPVALELPEGAQSLTLLDPASGSGHILVRAFDVLVKAYEDDGYTAQQAAREILKYNLWGLDICPRAGQLARFALLMKAAEKDRSVWQNPPSLNIFVFPDGEGPRGNEWARWFGDEHRDAALLAEKLNQDLKQARNLGSIIVAPDRQGLADLLADRRSYWQSLKSVAEKTEQDWIERMEEAASMWQALVQKYATVVANPPYMGQKHMNGQLKTYVNKNYPLTSADLFAVFMEVCFKRLHKLGRYSMINQHSWMFLSTFEEFREKVLEGQCIENMLHLGPRTFEELSGEVVQSTAFTVVNNIPKASLGTFYRLVEYRNGEDKQEALVMGKNQISNVPQSNFSKIPGRPIAYWASGKILEAFENLPKMESVAPARIGMMTTDNERFVKCWAEVSLLKIGFNLLSRQEAENSHFKWFPYNKGGPYRKWFGNNSYVVNWEKGGLEIKENGMTSFRGKDYYFKTGITWGIINADDFCVRYKDTGFIFDIGGTSSFPSSYVENIVALLNSRVSSSFLAVINPTMNFQGGNINSLPYKSLSENEGDIQVLSQGSIEVSRSDWDSREASWNFQSNPLVNQTVSTLELASQAWHREVSNSFLKLHQNEEELNRIFIGIYGLENELTPDVAYKDITILQDELDYKALDSFASKGDEQDLIPIRKEVPIQQLLHYAIGCLMGRYRLDKPGLHIAHPGPYSAEDLEPIGNGLMDEDGLIPFISEDLNPFTDNVLQGIRNFLASAWSEKSLPENLNFLGQHFPKGWQHWILKDFYKFHLSFYQKRPIYWMFSSRNGSFQVLAYMHRMANNRFAVQQVRERYLVPMLRHIATQLEELANRSLSREQAVRNEKLEKVQAELREYDEVLKALAKDEITFDLDDGVKINYPKFGNALVKVF